MRKLTEKFIAWCKEDTPAARFERTVFQGLIGVGCALLAYFATDNPFVAMAVQPSVMAVIAPMQKAIGNRGEVEPGHEG